MKNTAKIVGILTLALVLFNCSSVKVASSWKDVKTTNIKEKNVLVINKTDNDVARIQFESDLVKHLNSNQIKATESFKIFPKISMHEELDDNQLKSIKDNLKADGIDVILLTVLKNVEDYETTTTTGGTSYHINSYPVFYGRRYRGFYRPYNTIYVNDTPTTSVTTSSKKYVLETITYDLTQPEDNQLIAVITTEIDNPETLGTTSKDFSKKVIKELIKS